MPKIRCPKHEDLVASCEVYQDHAFCFSNCGFISLEELGIEGKAIEPRRVEDIDATLTYIESLPTKEIRGFNLPFDDAGYYLVWPDRSYYKLRRSSETTRDKYRNPSGHSQPLFVAQASGDAAGLFIVEGEFNSLSVARAFPEWTVVSPGSTGEFMGKKQESYLRHYRNYDNVVIITDPDDPGRKANTYTRILIGYQVPFVYSVFLEPDANEIHCQEGADKLREAVNRQLPERLQGKAYAR